MARSHKSIAERALKEIGVTDFYHEHKAKSDYHQAQANEKQAKEDQGKIDAYNARPSSEKIREYQGNIVAMKNAINEHKKYPLKNSKLVVKNHQRNIKLLEKRIENLKAGKHENDGLDA